MKLGRIRLFAAFLIVSYQAGPAFAERAGAFDPFQNAGNLQGNLRNPNQVADRGNGGVGVQGGNGQAPVNARGAIAAAEREVGRPLTNEEKATVNSAIADANTAAGHQVSPQVAAGIASFLVQNPEVASNQPARNQVVNAFVWGSQFISAGAGGALNFSVRSEAGKAVVVPNEGATTRNMQIVVPGARATGPVNMTATAGNGLGFNMTRSDIRAGSGQFVSSVRMENPNAAQNGAFNGVRNIEGHQDNGGAVQAQAPNVQGRGAVDVTFSASPNRNGQVIANWQSNTPSTPVSPGQIANNNVSVVTPAVPPGHETPASPHGATVSSLPQTVTLPSVPTALNVAGTQQIPNSPTIPAGVVNHIAGGQVPGAPSPGEANPAALVVQTVPAGSGRVMVVQLPPQAANATRAFSAGETAPVQVQVTPVGGGAPITVWASANRESNNNEGGRSMGSRNGTLSFVVPAGFQVASIQTQSATTNFKLTLNPPNPASDQNLASLEMMRR
jgi:hypothetical protein